MAGTVHVGDQRPELWWWLVVTPLAAGLVTGGLVAVALAFSGLITEVDPETGQTMAAGVVVVALLAALVGAGCGLVVGGICAGIVASRARRGRLGSVRESASMAGWVSAGVCTAICVPFLVSEPPSGFADVLLCWILPTTFAGVAGSVLGAMVWTVGTRTPSGLTGMARRR